jgi:hypothetical protein
MPYPHELCKEDRILADRRPRVLDEVARMNPEPMPVMRPFRSVSPEEYSLEVSPTKLAIFLVLVKRERSSPSSRTGLIAVHQPIPGRLRAIVKALW